MEVIFLNSSGQTLFTRLDMESGHWVQEEMSVNADFPLIPEKLIQTGQRIAFRDPVTDVLQVFEIRNVTLSPGDSYQQITAEHIVISELSDEHLNTTEITDKTAAQALTSVLTGTLWSLGTNTASGTQSADFGRGSVWDAVNTIRNNWNVYITPRITISSAGAITGRYLDIAPAEGTWRGVRLSINKNLIDPIVTYDDSEVYTALHGYGGTISVPGTGGAQDTSEELTFADAVWTATSSHPAKPAGQKYLEWPEKTAIYGRNGRPRYGYYQNGNITDANILLEKTWETLKKAAEPIISISGTCVDLSRLGYKDQPMSLHDIAIVEIEGTGEVFQKEIIRFDMNLVNPSGSTAEIGNYIPNIIYINRETEEQSSGGNGGGGGRHGQTNVEHDDGEFYSEWIQARDKIGMVVGTYNGGYKIEAGKIILAMNSDGGSEATIDADVINMNGVVQALDAYDISCGNLTCGSINCTDITSQGNVHGDNLTADISIDSDGDITAGGDIDATGDITAGGNISATGNVSCNDITCHKITASSDIQARDFSGRELTLTRNISCADITGDDIVGNSVTTGTFMLASQAVTWQSKTVVTDIVTPTLTTTTLKTYVAKDGTEQQGRLVTGWAQGSFTTATLNYLGK